MNDILDTLMKQIFLLALAACALAANANANDDDATIRIYLHDAGYNNLSAADLTRIRICLKETGLEHIWELDPKVALNYASIKTAIALWKQGEFLSLSAEKAARNNNLQETAKAAAVCVPFFDRSSAILKQVGILVPEDMPIHSVGALFESLGAKFN
jgi:hypothetical protein